jgi:hypothetical protein
VADGQVSLTLCGAFDRPLRSEDMSVVATPSLPSTPCIMRDRPGTYRALSLGRTGSGTTGLSRSTKASDHCQRVVAAGLCKQPSLTSLSKATLTKNLFRGP